VISEVLPVTMLTTLVIALATPAKQIGRGAGWFLVASYPVFLLAMVWL